MMELTTLRERISFNKKQVQSCLALRREFFPRISHEPVIYLLAVIAWQWQGKEMRKIVDKKCSSEAECCLCFITASTHALLDGFTHSTYVNEELVPLFALIPSVAINTGLYHSI